MGGGRRGGASPLARVLSEVGRHARAGTLGLHNADGPRGSTLEVMLCRKDGEQQPSQSPKDWLTTTPSLWGQLTSGLDGFWVLGVKGQGRLALATGSSVAKVSHELRDHVRGSGLVREGSP